MKIFYIILAHQNPGQVKRLIQRLTEPWTKFFIHIDKNKDIEPFKKIMVPGDQIVFLNDNARESGTWGDIGIVKATLNAMKRIIEEDSSGVCVLMSGQDYPLTNNSEIRSFFRRNPGKSYCNIFPLPYAAWEKGGLNRLNRYKINKSSKRGHFIQLPSLFEKDFYSWQTIGRINFLRKTGNYEAIRLLFKKRKFPSYLKPYGGEQWWALPTEVVKEIIIYTEEHPDFLDYNKYTLLPDEIFFNSIIKEIQEENKILPSITYTNWRKKEVPLPVTFTSQDFNELKGQSPEFLFARKFDIEIDEYILSQIDKNLIQ